MGKLSHNFRRAILGGIGIVALIFFLDYYASLNWFGGFGWYAMLAALALLMVALPFIGPDTRSGSK